MTANTTITLAGINSADAVPELLVIRVARQLVGARRDQFVEIPGRPGSWPFAEAPGDRTLRIEFDLQADSFAGRRAAVEALADWADTPAGAVQLIVDDEPDRFWTAVLESAPDVDEWLTVGTGELTYRTSPYSFNVTPAMQTFTAAGPGKILDSSINIPERVEVYPIIEITPTDGTLLTLDLSFDGESSLSWAGLIASGETLTVSSISDTITHGVSTDVNVTGAYNPAALAMADLVGEFPILLPGPNDFVFIWSGTATAVSFKFTWQRRYR